MFNSNWNVENEITANENLNGVYQKKSSNFKISLIFIIVSFLLYMKNRYPKTKIIEKYNQKPEEHIKKEFLYDYNYYISNYMNISRDLNSLEYSLVIIGHTLEKGFCHFKLRPFGIKKINRMIYLLKKETKYEKHGKLFSFINGINLLREYKKIYELNNWTNYDEYKKVSKFLDKYQDIEIKKVGCYILDKVELEKDYKIDYKKFIKSRHSTRNYKNKELKKEDILSAVEMAKYSPSACNRQNIKLHYYPSWKMKKNVIDFSFGKGGIYLSGVSTFIITFDVK
jgi:hypothetical protein